MATRTSALALARVVCRFPLAPVTAMSACSVTEQTRLGTPSVQHAPVAVIVKQRATLFVGQLARLMSARRGFLWDGMSETSALAGKDHVESLRAVAGTAFDSRTDAVL